MGPVAQHAVDLVISRERTPEVIEAGMRVSPRHQIVRGTTRGRS